MVYGTQSTLKEVLSSYTAKVLLTKELTAQVAYLHNKCPKNTEWSGLLIWELTKGSIEDLSDLEIKCHAVFPMDFGDATFTSFEGNDSWLRAFAQFPQIDPMSPTPGWYVNKIHSHHNMNVFHSGTDDGDIHTNTEKLPMFLSLIVNYACETDCKLAIAIETEEKTITYSKWRLKGWKKNKTELRKVKSTPKAIYILKCNVEYEQDQWFKDEIAELAKPKYEPPAYFSMQPTTVYKSAAKPGLIYKRMLSNLSELLTLGIVTDMSAYSTLLKVDSELNITDKEKYKKALKYYFLEHWYEETFYNVADCTEAHVLGEIASFMSFHEKLWVVKIITETLNELKTEYIELRAVQGTSLV